MYSVNPLGFVLAKNLLSTEDIQEFAEVTSDANKAEMANHAEAMFLRPPHEDDKFPLNLSKASKEVLKLSEKLGDSVVLDKKRQTILIGSVELDLHEKWAYDHNRTGVRATKNACLDDYCRKVHEKLDTAIPEPFRSSAKYQPFRKYRSDIASALRSMENALRQPLHTDTSEKEALSALVATRGSFRLLVVKNSLALIRRIAQMRAQWLRSGRPVPKGMSKDGLKAEQWFDSSCYAQLRREGWGMEGDEEKRLDIFSVTVEEGSAIIFSTWLLHAGAEFSPGDIACFNRIHFYLVWWPVIGKYKTTNIHRTMVEADGMNFSPALHFVPKPDPSLAPAAGTMLRLF